MVRKTGDNVKFCDLDENNLFRIYKTTKNDKYRDKLVLKHLNLVRFVANRFVYLGEPIEDLIQVGVIGLIKAIDRFDPERGIKFATYATSTIMGEIKRHFRDTAWSLKVPRYLMGINFKANKASESLSQILGRKATLAEVARKIDVDEELILEAMEASNGYDTISFSSVVHYNIETTPKYVEDIIGEYDENIVHNDKFGDLNYAMSCLNERKKAVVYFRYFEEQTQSEVAEILNISQMHVSRLEKQALEDLKEILTGHEEEIKKLMSSSERLVNSATQ